MAAEVARYRVTATDYQRMTDAGIFHEDDRVELLAGEIIEIAPIGPGHAVAVNRALNAFLPLQTEWKAIVSLVG